jgi:ribosomal protein L35AE/L33A
MIILHIEHTVPHFDNWKASFDNYAELRQKTGVRSYQISRPVDNPNFVMIDLQFDHQQQAEALLGAVQEVWQRVSGTLIQNPQWRFHEVVETKAL